MCIGCWVWRVTSQTWIGRDVASEPKQHIFKSVYFIYNLTIIGPTHLTLLLPYSYAATLMSLFSSICYHHWFYHKQWLFCFTFHSWSILSSLTKEKHYNMLKNAPLLLGVLAGFKARVTHCNESSLSPAEDLCCMSFIISLSAHVLQSAGYLMKQNMLRTF